jgi:nucleoside-diphosphate-sugar epimerase
MPPRTVLVTGAGGFVGGRLVERLREDGVAVHALIRDGTKAARLAALGCAVHRGDVTLPDTLAAAIAGCDGVVNCATGGSDWEQSRAVNVQGVQHVLTAAARAGVRRVVHVSSVVAHGRSWPPVLTESFPLQFTGDPYAVTKAEGERDGFPCAARLGVELAVVRPTIVYGPGSPRILLDLRRVGLERVKLLAHGRGLLNVVYVDDVVDALRLAMTVPAAAGRGFLVSGAAPVTVREYYAAIAAMRGKAPPPAIALWRGRLEAAAGRWYFRFTRRPAIVEDNDIGLMSEHARVGIDEARRALGWEPRTSFADGMRRTEAWLRRRGWLPGAGLADAA